MSWILYTFVQEILYSFRRWWLLKLMKNITMKNNVNFPYHSKTILIILTLGFWCATSVAFPTPVAACFSRQRCFLNNFAFTHFGFVGSAPFPFTITKNAYRGYMLFRANCVKKDLCQMKENFIAT